MQEDLQNMTPEEKERIELDWQNAKNDKTSLAYIKYIKPMEELRKLERKNLQKKKIGKIIRVSLEIILFIAAVGGFILQLIGFFSN